MAGPVVTPANRPLVGVIPCADRSGAIGGAPPPLLQTGSGTFLERAIALLRVAEVDHVVVGVRDRRDPVAAQALRAGATVIQVEEGEHDPAASLKAAAGTVRGGSAPPTTAGTCLLLPPTYPLIRDETMAELARSWREAATPPEILAPSLPPDSPRAGTPWWELAPLFLRGPDPAARLATFAGIPNGTLEPPAEDLAGDLAGAPLVRIEVVDPGVSERIDTLPLYRRHFPQAFRKRFQKW